MNALMLVIVTLAVYRVSVLIAQDEGPFSVLEIARSHIDPNQSTWLGRGLRCVGCVSFWVSLVAAMAFNLDWWLWLWLGIAGGAMFIHRITK